MIYLARKNGAVIVHTDLTAMKSLDGITKAEKTITEEEWYKAEGLARLIDNEIFIGKTEDEKTEEAKQEKIAECKAQLNEIDGKSGAGRHVRDVSVSAGVVLDAVRVLLTRFARELNINVPNGFGAGVATATDILNLAPPEGVTETEKSNFVVYKALLLISYYDPAINPGLTAISQAEAEAIPIRAQLALLQPVSNGGNNGLD